MGNRSYFSSSKIKDSQNLDNSNKNVINARGNCSTVKIGGQTEERPTDMCGSETENATSSA